MVPRQQPSKMSCPGPSSAFSGHCIGLAKHDNGIQNPCFAMLERLNWSFFASSRSAIFLLSRQGHNQGFQREAHRYFWRRHPVASLIGVGGGWIHRPLLKAPRGVYSYFYYPRDLTDDKFSPFINNYHEFTTLLTDKSIEPLKFHQSQLSWKQKKLKKYGEGHNRLAKPLPGWGWAHPPHIRRLDASLNAPHWDFLATPLSSSYLISCYHKVHNRLPALPWASPPSAVTISTLCAIKDTSLFLMFCSVPADVVNNCCRWLQVVVAVDCCRCCCSWL